MSRFIYIQNSAGIAASDPSLVNPEDVADGKIVLLNTGGGAIGLNNNDTCPDEFQIVRGTPDADEPAVRSGILKRSNIKSVTFQAYSAPTPQVTTITPVAGSSADGTAGLKITRIDGGFEKYPRQSYEITVDSGDSIENICDKLRTAISDAKEIASTINTPNAHIITTSGTTTLILTAITPSLHKTGTYKSEYISFATSLYGDAVDNWTIASTTPPEPGHGSYQQVAEFENRAHGGLGFKYTEHYPQRPEHYADSSTTYDLLTLEMDVDGDKAINNSFLTHQHVIAVKAGELTEGVVLAIFGESASSPSP